MDLPETLENQDSPANPVKMDCPDCQEDQEIEVPPGHQEQQEPRDNPVCKGSAVHPDHRENTERGEIREKPAN